MKFNLLKFFMLLFACFGLTTWLSAAVIQVAAGDNAIGDALLDASPGDIIELTTSGGVYTDSAALSITFDVTIRAAAGLERMPIIDGGTNDPVIEITTGGLNLAGIKFKNGGYVIHVSATDPVTSSDFSLKINNCEFHNWTERAVYTSDATLVPLDSIIVNNTIFQDGAKQAFYLKQTRNESNIFPGGYKYCNIKNCLITGLTDSGDGMATYIEPGNRDIGDQGWPKVIIDHVTVDNCMGGIYTYTTPDALVQNCIVSNILDADNFKCFDVQTGRWQTEPLPPPSHLINSIYCGGSIKLDSKNGILSITENVDSVAPVYVDAAHGNYALAEGSPGKNAATDGIDIGYVGPGPEQEIAAPQVMCPGFEEDTALLAWESDWDNSSINTNMAYVHSGTKSLKIGPGAGGRAQYPAVTAIGQMVSLLAWGTADGELNEPAWIGFVAVDEFGIETEVEGNTHDGPELLPMGEWTRLCASQVIPVGTVELRVYFWYSGDEDNNVASVYVDDYEFVLGDSCVPVKTQEIAYNSFVNVYPNPTSGLIRVTLGKDFNGASSLEIFDITGKVVRRVNDLNGRKDFTVDITGSPAGMYFGMIRSQGQVHSFKILKNQ